MPPLAGPSKGWSIEIATWNNLRAVWPTNWKRIPLDNNYSHRIEEDTSGVYLICAGLRNLQVCAEITPALYTILYIGQGKLQERFLSHCNAQRNIGIAKAKLTYRQLDFWFSTQPSVDLRTLEQRCIDAFGPPINKINAIRATVGEPINL